jgi:hypothetical protein
MSKPTVAIVGPGRFFAKLRPGIETYFEIGQVIDIPLQGEASAGRLTRLRPADPTG